MIKRIGLIVVVVIIAFFIFVATRPDTFRIERSATMKATPDKIFALIDDFHVWPTWSPWEGLDPAMQRSYSGPASGVGAAYSWTGNNKVGQGRMEITSTTPASDVTIKLDFLKPFEAHNATEFTLVPKGDSTQVVWSMSGHSNFMSKTMGVFFNVDKLVGKEFETGLAKMKAVAESGARA